MDFDAIAENIEINYTQPDPAGVRVAIADALRDAYKAGRSDQAAWVDTFTDDQQ